MVERYDIMEGMGEEMGVQVGAAVKGSQHLPGPPCFIHIMIHGHASSHVNLVFLDLK